MGNEAFLSLVNNMAILLLLGLAYDLLYTHQREKAHLLRSITIGVVLSLIGIIVMLIPWKFSSGIIFDTRSILLCISGLFFGIIPTIIVSVTTIILRIFLSGSGTIPGILIITSSAAIGLLWKHIWRGKSNYLSFFSLYTLGWVVHIVMLLLTLSFPRILVVPLLKQLTIPILIIFPFGTVLLGSLLKMRMDQLTYARELQISNERLQVTFRSIGDGVITTDLEGNVDLINISAEKLTGWTQGQAAGKSLEKVFPIYNAKTNNQAVNPVKKVIETGSIQVLANHTKLISKDGTEYQIADSAAPIRNKEGKINGVVLVFRDITQQYQMREEIKVSENLYRAIFHNTGTATCILGEDGKIQLANSRFADLTGYSLEEIQEKMTWMDFTSSDDLPKMKEQHKLRRKDREKALKEYEFTLIDKQQHKKSIRLLIDMIPETSNSIASLLDISIQRHLEEDLRNTIGLLSSLVNSIPDLISYKSPEGFYQGCNPSFEKYVGKKEIDIVGKTDYDLFDKETADFLRFHDKNMFAKMKTTRNEEWITYPDGKKVLLDTIKTPYKNADGETIGLLGIGRDITELRKASDERETLNDQLLHIQKLDSVGRLAGGIAHDFNNMLSVIQGYSELALSQLPENSPLYENLEEILKASKRSADITKKLLAFARKQSIAPKVLNINSEMESMLNMLSRLIGENIQLEFIPGDNLWTTEADPSQLDQIITNLCINAKNAITDTGWISIKTDNITINDNYCINHVEFMPGDFVLLTVSDNGCGIDKEIQENIFEPFFTTRKLGEGAGLGLSTVYGIVKQNNGFIQLYSEVGEGTTFKIYLPRYTGTSEADINKPVYGTPKGNKETILLVEDEQTIRMLAKYMIERLNYNVIITRSSQEAIRLVEKQKRKIDVLITDVVMPEMNGKELSSKIKKTIPSIKVIYMSGYTANIIVHKGILEEGIHFLQKPFSQFDIAQKIKEALDDD